ncbi:FmdE family protein [Anaerolineales bacterium HSG24]|nr:FmdE family protein [Anaerolineales bacterium HSG24]
MLVNVEKLLEKSANLHTHLCPRQVLGVRMGLFGGQILDLPVPQKNKRMFVFMETDGCGADGVSIATGCWIGKRTMRVVDFGKMAATFVDSLTEQAIRVIPLATARKRAWDYAPSASDRWSAQLSAYQQMPDEELFTYQYVTLAVSLRYILSRHGYRVNCEICGEEIMNEREIIREETVMCQFCAGSCYYSIKEQESKK